MISAIAEKIYIANAGGIQKMIPPSKIKPISPVESHSYTSPHSLHDESVKVSISDEAQNMLALMRGEKLPVEHLPDPSVNDYGKQLKHKKQSTHPLNSVQNQKQVSISTQEPPSEVAIGEEIREPSIITQTEVLEEKTTKKKNESPSKTNIKGRTNGISKAINAYTKAMTFAT